MRRTRLLIITATAALSAALLAGPIDATSAAPIYAIRGARVFTAAGAPLENATVVLRDGVIADVGAGLTAPPDAIVIDGAGLNVYPGLIDMANSAPFGGDDNADPQAGGRGGRGGRGGGEQASQFSTLEEAERAKREAILRPHYMAAANLSASGPALGQLASAGVTTVLAVPSQGIFKGQSALVNVVLAPDDPQISTIADYRRGLAVVKSPVASHINMAGRGGGQGYPQSLLGTIAFTRQGLLDAEWQRDAQAHYQKGGGRGPRPVVDPALDALVPVLSRELPAAFDASEAREIDRALAIASQFKLDPIVVGALGAGERTAELSKAKARVILSLNLPGQGRGGGAGAGGGGGGRGGGGAQSLRALQEQQNAPKIPAALATAGIPFAFTSGGQTAGDFVRTVGRVIKEGGLAPDIALRALTIEAARIARASDRTGSIEKGKIGNVIVVEGDLFDGGRIRHVFVDGNPVTLEAPPAQGQTGRGRGGM
jgi:imidazolonepropionase-like amidohydrolase